ncbi:hypothetical protein FQN57_006821 [Myotisia sp. PD_48]|nr:hypothetical protein FQN57_006821 [Myotisia sp. PD_48]
MDTTTSIMDRLDSDFVECWDDDEDLHFEDGFQIRTVSTNTSVTGSSVRPSGHRDSISSRRSWRSDRDSNLGDDESWQLLLNDNDSSSTQDAITSAKRAGIPIPAGVPNSALLGGSIKKLGTRKIKTILGDDWWEDLDLSAFKEGLELKSSHQVTSPDSLLHLGSLSTSTSSLLKHSDNLSHVLPDLVKFRDVDDDNPFQHVPAIKLSKSRVDQDISPRNTMHLTEQDDKFETEFILPEGDEPLRLSTRRDVPKLSDPFEDDFDTEWAEGSIGVRFGGTQRETRSNRGSSIGAFSPSMSSCLTMESEDDGLDGLILPDGPLDLEKSLQNRRHSIPPATLETTRDQNRGDSSQKLKTTESFDDDFFFGIEIGDGEAFDPGKLTLNRNVKRKSELPVTPPRRGGTSITFTNRNTPTNTRIPRLSTHERTHSTQLEPVSESGAPVPQFRRPHSRLSGHASHSSLSSIPLPAPQSIISNRSPPSRRSFGGRSSKDNELSSTISQSLKTKRSAPAMRSIPTGTSTLQAHRSPPRHEAGIKPVSSRPKTPIERSSVESRLAHHRRSQVPFIPAGGPESQSHHVNVKSSRQTRRTDSESSTDSFLHPRSRSRTARWGRSTTPNKPTHDLPEGNAPSAKKTIRRPTRRKNFGDGTELDIFDDLPTSASAESKFMKTPAKRGAPRSLRSKLSQSHITVPMRVDTPAPSPAPNTTSLQDATPRFARDTNASRNAREQRIASMNQHQRDRDSGPLAPLSTNWKTPGPSRPFSTPSTTRNRHGHKHSISRPHLIKPMGSGVQESKNVKGMQYNPALYRWEGNENITIGFDVPTPLPAPKPSPALISHVGGVSGSQVVGQMVFDPQRMCWLKLGSSRPGSKGDSIIAPEDEEDIFAGLEDLVDRRHTSTAAASAGSLTSEVEPGPAILEDKSGESSDEWPITEEFDVGPEFIRRQRAEEEKWRRKVSKWTSEGRNKLGDEWRWAIRNLVGQGNVDLHAPALPP